MWHSIDPRAEGPPREFSLGGRPSVDSAPAHPEARQKPDISPNLRDNLRRVQDELDAEHSTDVVIRPFRLAGRPPRAAFLLYIDGLADRVTASRDILKPLMVLAKTNPEGLTGDVLSTVEESLAPGAATSREATVNGALEKVLTGMTAVFVDGAAEALLIESKGWEKRSVDRPQQEPAVRAPQEGFTETLRVNTALVRRRLRTPNLTVENIRVGKLTQTDVAVLHIRGLTNPKLVEEVRRRLRNIREDYLAASGLVEQLIQDRPRSPFPQALPTERPDRVAAALAEGYVGLIVDTTPWALIVPATFTSVFQTAEDHYLRWPLGTAVRFIRVVSSLVTLMLPGFYVAAVSYHAETVPTSLLLAIAATRATVPFPIWVEVLIMELAFQLVREAGIRIPSIIGPTIGIVGALILGQAAVAANIISPIPVVLVSVTALGSFVVPNYQASFSLQLLRFAGLAAGALMGFYGLALVVYLISLHLANLTSFGVPYLSPVGPYRPGSPDVVLRGPTHTLEERPSFLRPLRPRRQPEPARQWDRPDGGGDNP